MSRPATVYTAACLSLPGDHLYRRFRVMSDLAGRQTLTDLLWLSVQRESPTDLQRRVLDDIATVSSVGDPRIWPLKVARIVASEGSAIRGLLAGQLMLDGALIGPYTCRHSAELLLGVQASQDAGAELPGIISDAISKRARLPGFGVAFRSVDERVAVLTACLARRGSQNERCYYRLFEAIADVVRDQCNLEPNFGIAMAAALLDLGLSPSEIGAISVALLNHLFLANAFEAAADQPSAYRRLPPEAVEYVGPGPRRSPRCGRP
ncbi:MAG: hypothetical protein JRH11_24310 [Deltaproteobacteria bacterium]|nr:hypothetical protein [Deltaproteobacteria bacterium]